MPHPAPMTSRTAFLWLNGLTLLLVGMLTLYAKLFSSSVSLLFLAPIAPESLDIGFFTRLFQILCSLPPVVCSFSFALMRRLRPHYKGNWFLLISACLMTGFLLNQIFRLHIVLYLTLGIPKLATIGVFALIAIAYLYTFWYKILSTPYLILLVGIGCLAFGIVIDTAHLPGDGTPTLLEGIPKVFSVLNLSLYYWQVCAAEIITAFRRVPYLTL
jgi:hypothetical protein